MNEELEKPEIIGKVHVVACVDCFLIQDWKNVQEQGHCTSEQVKKGWAKCFSTKFYDIET